MPTLGEAAFRRHNGQVTVPRLDGIHHLKVHVGDLRGAARWYVRVLGYVLTVEFVEGESLVGYGFGHPDGGTILTLRLDPEHAAETAGRVYFEMGVPDLDAMHQLAAYLDGIGEPHGPVVRTPIGWLLPGLFDPEGHEIRFYHSESEFDWTHQPIRLHDPGPRSWREDLDQIEL